MSFCDGEIVGDDVDIGAGEKGGTIEVTLLLPCEFEFDVLRLFVLLGT